MKAFLQYRLARKLLMLFLLSGALVYLRQPQQAQALANCSCVIGCVNGYARCRNLCNGDASCIDGCKTTYLDNCANDCPNAAACCPNGGCGG